MTLSAWTASASASGSLRRPSQNAQAWPVCANLKGAEPFFYFGPRRFSAALVYGVSDMLFPFGLAGETKAAEKRDSPEFVD